MFGLIKVALVFSGMLPPENPVHFYARLNDAERVADCIYKKGINPLRKDKFGDTGFHIAAANSPAALELLLQPYSWKCWHRWLSMPNKHGLTPLEVASDESLQVISDRLNWFSQREIASPESEPKRLDRKSIKERLQELAQPPIESDFVAAKAEAETRCKARRAFTPEMG